VTQKKGKYENIIYEKKNITDMPSTVVFGVKIKDYVLLIPMVFCPLECNGH
jgi:hypothetical protein